MVTSIQNTSPDQNLDRCRTSSSWSKISKNKWQTYQQMVSDNYSRIVREAQHKILVTGGAVSSARTPAQPYSKTARNRRSRQSKQQQPQSTRTRANNIAVLTKTPGASTSSAKLATCFFMNVICSIRKRLRKYSLNKRK
jgi:hypothetical protein